MADNITLYDIKDFEPQEYVKVVRCKDCLYYVPEVDDPHKSTCQRLWGGMTECKADSYCSDGVRIVHCKECKYRHGDKDEPYCSRINPYSGMRVKDEDFCSWGEKNG